MISVEPVDNFSTWTDVVNRSPFADKKWADKTLRQQLAKSTVSYVGRITGKIACVWGLIPPTLLSDNAFLWMISTDTVDEHQFSFVRHSQIVIKELLEIYPTIYGMTTIDEERTLRWLKWLGATFSPGPDKEIYFSIKRRSE